MVINGRVPHARHRWKVAELLKEREDFLWPVNSMTALTTACTSEIIAAYARRGDVSSESWWRLFFQANQVIDLLGYAMLFIPEQHPRLILLLQQKVREGCKIRITIADPACSFVQWRDEEEQLGGTLLHVFRQLFIILKPFESKTGLKYAFILPYYIIRYFGAIMRCSLHLISMAYMVQKHLYFIYAISEQTGYSQILQNTLKLYGRRQKHWSNS